MTITKPQAGSGHSPPTLVRLPQLLTGFAPFYLRHFLLQPYRAPGPGGADLIKRPGLRHHIAMYDAVLEIMLKGYADLTGLRLRPETGQVAVRLMHLGFAFDDEFERRTAAGDSLDFDAVFGGAVVEQPLAQWRGFMQKFDTYASIREFLFGYVTTLYTRYRKDTEEAGQSPSFDELIAAAEWDSGGLLVTLAHVVGLFHAAPAPEDVIRQFSSLGVTAKLADDMVDLRSDLAGSRANLLAALAKEHEQEFARMTQALRMERRMTARWWRVNCPNSYARLSAVYGRHHAALASRWLRLANGLMWTPVLVGHSSVTDRRGRV